MSNKKRSVLALLLTGMMAASVLLSACSGSDAPAADDTASTASEEATTDPASDDGEEGDLASEDAETEEADAEDAGTAATAADDDEDIDISSLPVDEFSYLITTATDATPYVDDYNDLPALQYFESRPYTVDGEKRLVKLDVWSPPAGGEGDYINTLIATDEYPDVISLAISNTGAPQLYEEGILLDITEEVEKYMPNYMAWVEENDYYNFITNEVDGERRIIQVYDVCDVPGDMWGGFEYRRDWIVKYGANPDTGEAFTGEWVDGEWEDDVVFPSGNTDPIYISDWEWMLDIFQTALEEEGIDDGYAYQLYYAGVLMTGDFISGFGGGGMWYLDKNQVCRFGITEDHTKAYIECMQTWWENGWIDPYFEEHSADMFFMIDTANVYSGKVGAWYGLGSQLGDGMGEDYVVFGAPQPINDVYGSAADQDKEPTNYYMGDLAATSFGVTNKVEGKNLGTLLSAIDSLYTTDGGMLRTKGLSKDEQAEFQSEIYNEYGLEDGAYEKIENADGTYTYLVHQDRINAYDNLSNAISMFRILGMTTNGNVDNGLSETVDRNTKLWTEYPATGNIPSTVSNQMTSEQSEAQSLVSSNMLTYVSTNLPLFITGQLNLDSDWDSFVSDLQDIGVENYCDVIDGILGN